MKIVAVDPGAVATGVAMVYQHADSWAAKQFKDPLDAWSAVENEFDECGGVHFLIEDFRTAGHLTKEGKATVGLVRFFELATLHYHAYTVEKVVIRVEQHRLSGQREAAELMGGTIDELKSDPDRKDAFSALAHCCVYRRGVK